MRIHYLQHVHFEGPGAIDALMRRSGMTVTYTRFHEAWELPDPGGLDFVVVLGGPMSVNDGMVHPWLPHERAFIRRAIDAGTRVLGICLGAQLIASALGARVHPNSEKEIGWFPVTGVASAGNAVYRFPLSFPAFHWHGETFDLPAGAVPLARSAACAQQAFQVGRRVIGLQFHLETTPAAVRDLVDHCGDDLIPARFVQSQDEILGVGDDVYGSLHTMMSDLLQYLMRD